MAHEKVYGICEDKCFVQLNKIDEVLLSASKWSSSAPYKQTVTVPGMLETLTPTIDLLIPNNANPVQVKSLNKAYSMLDSAVSGNGSITFTCFNKKPAVDFSVKVKGV